MADEDREIKALAVKNMIEMLNSEKSFNFHVMLFQYYIDTERYPASALTVSENSTPNMRQTPNGFECDAFFPPDMLRPGQREGKEIVNGVIRVSLYVNLDDIVGIFIVDEDGETIPLYTPTSG